MRKMLAFVAAIALPLSMAGCGGTDETKFIEAVQNATATACAFLPAVETVAAIFTANASLVPAQVANAICQAITNATSPEPTPGMKPGQKAGNPMVTVGNQTIVIRGQFLSGRGI